MRSQSLRWIVPMGWAAGMLAARWIGPATSVAGTAILLTVLVVSVERASIARLLVPAPRMVLSGLLAAAVMVAVTLFLVPPLLGRLPLLADRSSALYMQFVGDGGHLALLLLVIPIVVAEEILWRGAFQSVAAVNSRTASTLVAATVYALAHVPLGSPLLVAIALICGLYWSALRATTRSIVPPLIAHLAWDIAVILVPPVTHAR